MTEALDARRARIVDAENRIGCTFISIYVGPADGALCVSFDASACSVDAAKK
jgi:hypothetical protein